jgi:predicted porin
MKHILAIAAVSTLASGAALAQSTVTLYGRVNLAAESVDFNNVKLKKLNDIASRWGLKGSEDLGGGLKAGFQLESGFSADTGAASSTFWGRQAEVNLSGAFGKVRLGRFTSDAYFATADYVSMHNHDTGDSEDALYAYIGRNSNKIAYGLPEIVKGLSIQGSVSAPEGAAGTVRSWDGAINYEIGALALGLGTEKNDTKNQVALRALYDFGGFIVGGYYQRDKDGWGTGYGTRNNFRLSGAYMLGASEFHLNVGSAGNYSNKSDTSAKQFTLAYNYNLSKRTKVYTYYTKVADSSAHVYLSGNFGAAAAGNDNYSAIAFGIRHNF